MNQNAIVTFDWKAVEPFVTGKVIVDREQDRSSATLLFEDGSLLAFTAVLVRESSESAVPKWKFTYRAAS